MAKLRKGRAARLSDVARAAGVSLATASRALAGAGLVHPETLGRVREAVALLGYVPHGAARALASRRSRTLAAVIPTLDNPVFSASTHALQLRLAEDGYTLLLASHEYDLGAEVRMVQAFIERGVDGMLLVGLDHDPAAHRLLQQAGIPYELTWAIDASGFHHSLGFSNRRAAAMVAQHLLELGHRELAVVSGFTAYNDRARERVAGVREALEARGLALAPELVLETSFSIASGRRALVELLGAGRRFTAVACGNDILAMGVLIEAAARGIAVPGRLSVAGFDDIDLAAEYTPSLTTVHLPVAEIGRDAAERMLARLAGKAVPRVEEVKVELVVR
ncbi:MAG: substrate-binding domain-containing protein, partial [Burkholderiales bacterium]